MPKRSSTKWTPEDDERLLGLHAARKSNVSIAAALGRTRNSVISRLANLKVMQKRDREEAENLIGVQED
jgi:hypothetical protein